MRAGPLGQSGDITPGNSCDGPSSFRFSGPITNFTTSFCRSSQQHANVKCTWVNLMNFDFRLAIYGSIIDGMGKLGVLFIPPRSGCISCRIHQQLPLIFHFLLKASIKILFTCCCPIHLHKKQQQQQVETLAQSYTQLMLKFIMPTDNRFRDLETFTEQTGRVP